MNTVQRIAKNTGVLLVSQIASYILGFFFIMYTARYSGAEGFCTDRRSHVRGCSMKKQQKVMGFIIGGCNAQINI